MEVILHQRFESRGDLQRGRLQMEAPLNLHPRKQECGGWLGRLRWEPGCIDVFGTAMAGRNFLQFQLRY